MSQANQSKAFKMPITPSPAMVWGPNGIIRTLSFGVPNPRDILNRTSLPNPGRGSHTVAPPLSSASGMVAPPLSSISGTVAPPLSSASGTVAPPLSSTSGTVAPPLSEAETVLPASALPPGQQVVLQPVAGMTGVNMCQFNGQVIQLVPITAAAPVQVQTGAGGSG